MELAHGRDIAEEDQPEHEQDTAQVKPTERADGQKGSGQDDRRQRKFMQPHQQRTARTEGETTTHQRAGKDPRGRVPTVKDIRITWCWQRGRVHRLRPMASRVSRSAKPVSATMAAATKDAMNRAAQIWTV